MKILQRLNGWLTFALLYISAVSSQASQSSAGWAQVDVTPPLGIALGGRGGNFVAAKEILDPLFLQVSYLKDSRGSGLVLISVDLVGMTHDLSERIRTAVVHELGVEWNSVLINCSHTHSGPNMLRDILAGVGAPTQLEIDYFSSLREKAISAVRLAARNIKPVRVEVFEGKSEVAINRRGKNRNGKLGILPNPKGPIDDKVWIMQLSPLDGSAPAVVFSYACHPVIVYGYKGAAISADFPGVTRKRLNEKLGATTHVQFVQGLAGNVRPRACADVEKNLFNRGGPAVLEEAGNTLAQNVLAGLKTKARSLDLKIASASDRTFLPRGTPPGREVYEKMAGENSTYQKAVAAYWLKRYDAQEGFAKGDPWPMGLVRLADDQWIVYLAGEPVVEWRNKISQWLPGKQVVPFGYCPEANTYLPTESLLPEGGYEVIDCNRGRSHSPAPFAKGIEEAVRQSLLRQLAFINAQSP